MDRLQEKEERASPSSSEPDLPVLAETPSAGLTDQPRDVSFSSATSKSRPDGYPDSTYTSTTCSTISSRAGCDQIASSVIRQSLGACAQDGSEDTLIGDFTAKWESAEPPSELTPLPSKRGAGFWRRCRHRVFNAYQRLFALILLGNIIGLVVSMVQRRHASPVGTRLQDVSTATSANIAAAILMRQEYVINILYTIVCWTPHSFPLRARRAIAKFYHFGGVHSGCAASALLWFVLYTCLVTQQFVDGTFRSIPVLVLTYCLVLLLATICLSAIPGFRFVSHNTFEASHRFGGWLAVGLFWVQTFVVTFELSKRSQGAGYGSMLIQTPAFWFLVVITGCIVLPWLRLRKIQAWPEILSPRAARIHFNYRAVGDVVGIRIATNPLKEWHPFATIPEKDGSSFSILVSAAGDWTAEQIKNPAYSYWTRGIPISGILRMACIFKRVIVVTTGSGIGPCLSLLIAHPIPCRILWSSRRPLDIYGQGTMSAVMKADPEAIIIDTAEHRHPNLQDIGHHLYKDFDAEAVFIVSNRKTTRDFVYSLNSRGVPAYGPIWDS